MHLTAAFMGEVDESRVAPAADAVRDAAMATGEFAARLGEIGAFPSARRPRAIWVGLAEGGAEYSGATRRVREALSARGLPFDDAAPLAHITIARVRERISTAERKAVADAVGALRGTVPSSAFRVSELHLFRSTLSPKGPKYDSLARESLRPSND